MNDDAVSRREMFELAARAASLPGAAVFFAAFLKAQPGHSHAPAPPQPDLLSDYQPKFFSAADFQVLQAFTEILIPTDETPGAHEAHCAHFIDFVLQASDSAPQAQSNWRKALDALRIAGFHAGDAHLRLRLVTEMARPETEAGAQHPAYFAYRLIKQQTAFAFYTSRAGMIEALDYRGNSYNLSFPACTHPEHQKV
jgi:hypothetical protein